MAEPVYKKITELDLLSTALDGNETLPIVKSGKTYRRLWANFFGSGWITSLLAAFSAFKAPDADHSDDADTVGGEDKATLHTANNLTGVVPLGVIPAELTGKNAATATKLATARTIGGVSFDGTAPIDLPGVNTAGNQNTSGNAATATLAATATNALACSGNAATATTAAACSGNAATANNAYRYHGVSAGSAEVTTGSVYDAIVATGAIPNVGDRMLITGGLYNASDSEMIPAIYAIRTNAFTITLVFRARASLYEIGTASGESSLYRMTVGW